jgi:hypothetical protein
MFETLAIAVLVEVTYPPPSRGHVDLSNVIYFFCHILSYFLFMLINDRCRIINNNNSVASLHYSVLEKTLAQ